MSLTTITNPVENVCIKRMHINSGWTGRWGMDCLTMYLLRLNF